MSLAEQIRKIADTLSGLDLNTANKLDSIAKQVEKLEQEITKRREVYVTKI